MPEDNSNRNYIELTWKMMDFFLLQLKAFASAIYNSADANLAAESSREAMIAASRCANDRNVSGH